MANEQRTETEQNFISLLLTHKDLVGEWLASTLKPFHFEKTHKLLLFAIEEANKKNRILTKEAYFDFVKQRLSKEGEVNAQVFLYDQISILSPTRDNFDVLLNKILEAYVSENTITFIEKYKKEIPKAGALNAIKKLSKSLSDLTSDVVVEKNITKYEDISDYAPEFLEIIQEKRKGTPGYKPIFCGINEIDHTLVGGFAPGRLILFCADVGCFKTSIMLNIATNIWQNENDVLFVPLEMPREKMFQKFLSLTTKIPYQKIEYSESLSDAEMTTISSKINELQKPRPNHFYFMETYERIPVSIIRREIEKHLEVFSPKLVVVDYIANLISDTNRKSDRPDLEIGDMLKSLRVMGRPGAITEHGFSIISGAQIGRDKLKLIHRSGNKGGFHSEDLRGSHEYSADADAIFAQMPNEAQPDSRLEFFIVKSRFGPKTFARNETKAMLEIVPEIGLIRSINDSWLKDNSSSILKKVNDPTIDVNVDDQDLSFTEEQPVEEPRLEVVSDIQDDISVDDIILEEEVPESEMF